MKQLIHNRTAILCVGVLTLGLAGLIYAWSIFVAPLEGEFGWNRSETSFTFSVSMAFFAFGALANGQISKKLSHRVCFAIALAFMGIGFALCCLIRNLPELYLFYGALCGFGTGICYGVWNTAVVAWFDDRIGFASGLLLMGFGGGSLVFGSLASALIYSPIGWRTAFLILAVLVVVEGIVAMRFLQDPPPKRKPDEISDDEKYEMQLSGSQVVKTGLFWDYVAWRILVMGVGGAMIAEAAVMMSGLGADVWLSTLTVGLLGVGNGLGRPLTGALYDRLGQNRTMVVLPVIALVIAGGLILGYNTGNPAVFAVFIFLEGVLYGGWAAVNTSFMCVTFGQKNLAMNLGLASFALLPANIVFPMLAAFVFVASGSYADFFWVAPAMALIALIAGILIKPLTARVQNRWHERVDAQERAAKKNAPAPAASASSSTIAVGHGAAN